MSFYVCDRPVVGRGWFFGRELLVRSLLDGVHKRRSFAVCGGPKTGRTSLLGHVEWLVHERWQRQPTAAKVVPVRVDAADLMQRPPRFVPETLWSAIFDAIRDPRVTGDTPPADLPRPDWKRAKDPWDHLYEIATETFTKLRGTPAWSEYALFVDNFDLLLSTRELDAAQDLISEFARIDEDWSPVAVLGAGGRYLREHLLDERALFGFMRPMLLGTFRDPEAEKLIRSGIPDAEDDLINGLLAVTGKHPFALQRMLTEIEQRGLEIGVEGAVDGSARDCLALFDRVWAEFDLDRGVTYRGAYAAPEHALMQLISESQQGIDIKSAERELGIQPLKEYAEFLEYCGVAERHMLKDVMLLRPHFELFNIWYSERITR